MVLVLSIVFGRSGPQPFKTGLKPHCTILSCFVFHSGSAAVIPGRRLSRCRRERVRPCWTALAHEPVEVRPWPQHEVVVVWHEFVVIGCRRGGGWNVRAA